MLEAVDDELPPELAERFEVLEEIGRGAFGAVNRVRERSTRRTGALKLIPLGRNRKRVEREIAISCDLEHENVLRCFDGGVLGDQAYLFLELASGSLEDLLHSTDYRALAWDALKDAARGVAALHARGLVHRDVKPANVLMVGGTAKLADLGLAKGSGYENLTTEGMVLGSPLYMAPEQAKAEESGPAIDLWALGVIAYEIAEGSPPYPDVELSELMIRVANGQVEPMSRSLDWIPGPARAGIVAALSREPWDRPADAAAWAESLGPLGAPRPGSEVEEVEPEAPPPSGLAAETLAAPQAGPAPDATQLAAKPETAEMAVISPRAPPRKTEAPSTGGSSGARIAAAAALLALGAWALWPHPGDRVARQKVEEMTGELEVDRDGFVTALSVGGDVPTDADIAWMAGLSRLESLSVQSRKVTDEGIFDLVDVPRLRVLNLFAVQCTDDGLDHVAGFDTLEELSLAATRISDDGLRHLAGLKRLKKLNLYQCLVGDEGLAHLATLPALEHLNLRGTRITPRGLELLGRFPALKAVHLGRNDTLTAFGISALAGAENLEELGIHGTGLNPEDMATVAGLRRLKRLALPRTQVRGAALARLAGLLDLEELDLRGNRLGRRDLLILSPLQSLRLLKLKGRTPGVDALKRALPDLEVEFGY